MRAKRFLGEENMFRRIEESDRALYYRYVDAFYHSDAVESPVPVENYRVTFDEMMRSETYLRGYIFEDGGEPCGFVLLSRTFSQEAGGMSVTIEEIYVEPAYQNRGLATAFFRFLAAQREPMRLRIEVEDDNIGARRLYERMGFRLLPYRQMVIDRQRQNNSDSELRDC